MHKAILMLLLVAASSSAMAEWVKVLTSDIDTTYAELTTIQREGNTAKMVSLFDYKKVQKTRNGVTYRSIIEPGEYDCKEEKIRVLNFSVHSKNMGGGKVISSEFFSSSDEWIPLDTDSVDHILWKFACGKVSP